jgi:hypothetical protein
MSEIEILRVPWMLSRNKHYQVCYPSQLEDVCMERQSISAAKYCQSYTSIPKFRECQLRLLVQTNIIKDRGVYIKITKDKAIRRTHL